MRAQLACQHARTVQTLWMGVKCWIWVTFTLTPVPTSCPQESCSPAQWLHPKSRATLVTSSSKEAQYYSCKRTCFSPQKGPLCIGQAPLGAQRAIKACLIHLVTQQEEITCSCYCTTSVKQKAPQGAKAESAPKWRLLPSPLGAPCTRHVACGWGPWGVSLRAPGSAATSPLPTPLTETSSSHWGPVSYMGFFYQF